MPKTFRELVNEAKRQIREVSADDVERRRNAGEPILLIDVREAQNYQDGHVEGAVSIPRGVLEMKIDDETTDEERPIVVYCGGGSRGALAAKTLQELGYRNVASLAGGFRGWKEAGKPTE